ncbi:methyltransferase-like protein 6 [Ctenocephalides felis]|uniref:methyltransferase-like protein 6 n=1 Tax=Ctenocephalides felis TaxID=7515 RepID=UPI000E6E5436|nr:methyltransferase-like protein 6 [Ctenocephalides felis]
MSIASEPVEMDEDEVAFTKARELTDEEKLKLTQQDTRLVSSFKANKLEIDSKKNWDLFYKRNDTRFFKNRHWTTREFEELLDDKSEHGTPKKMLEIGCGVGNLIYPLIKDKLNKYFIYACDLSERAVDLVKSNSLYDENIMKAFQCDITKNDIFQYLENNSIDIVTAVFVLSAIHPDKFSTTLQNIFNILKPGGVLLFRDYGLYDMAQLRFKPGNKIADNFYVRQDGTRSFYFSTEYLEILLRSAGFNIISNTYIHRRTVNIKSNIDVPRIFVQGKYMKPYS